MDIREPADVFVDFSAPIGERVLGITLFGEPTPKGRPRLGGGGHVYTPSRTNAAQEIIGWQVRSALGATVPIFTHELNVSADFYCATFQRRDIDNLAKLLLDACNALVWKDDTQVGELHLRLERGCEGEARTELTVVRGKRISVDCATCGKEYVPTAQTRMRRNQKTYCSKPCYDEAQRKGEYRSCFTCGKRVYRQVEKLQYANSYCSAECKRLAKNDQTLCRQCGTAFLAYRSSKRGAPFCSPECSDVFHRNKKIKPSGHRWRTCTHCGVACTGRGAIPQCRACFLAAGRRKAAAV